MTGARMSAERLAELREEAARCVSHRGVDMDDLLAELDAVTAERDSAESQRADQYALLLDAERRLSDSVRGQCGRDAYQHSNAERAISKIWEAIGPVTYDGRTVDEHVASRLAAVTAERDAGDAELRRVCKGLDFQMGVQHEAMNALRALGHEAITSDPFGDAMASRLRLTRMVDEALGQRDAARAERDALNMALVALTAEVEEHIADVTCENGALRRAVAPARTCTCAVVSPLGTGPRCPGCVELARAGT